MAENASPGDLVLKVFDVNLDFIGDIRIEDSGFSGLIIPIVAGRGLEHIRFNRVAAPGGAILQAAESMPEDVLFVLKRSWSRRDPMKPGWNDPFPESSSRPS